MDFGGSYQHDVCLELYRLEQSCAAMILMMTSCDSCVMVAVLRIICVACC